MMIYLVYIKGRGVAISKETYFATWRSLFDNNLWLHILECRLFIFLVGKARRSKQPNYKLKPVIIKQGQYLRSYRKLLTDLEYIENNSIKHHSLSRIKTAVDTLVNQGRIKTEKTELGTLFTVVNYYKYQINKDATTDLEQGENGARTARERDENNNKNVLGGGEGNSCSLPNYRSEVNSTLLQKKSHKDFSRVTEDHEKFIETFLKWVQREHATYWRGWVKGCNSELELYIKMYNAGLDTIDKLQRIDGYSTEQIFKACRWAMEDKFWKKQFRSLVKLRRKNAEGVKYIVEFTDRYERSDKGRLESWINGG